MMINKIRKSFYLFLPLIFAFFLVGCGPHNPNDGLYIKNKNYFVNYKIANSKTLKRFSSMEITKDQLSNVPSLNEHYHSPILVGGYGEPRKFYAEAQNSKRTSINYHAGTDVLLKEKTKILAPANGQVFAGWWYSPVKETIARGVGGEIGFRTKIDNLFIKPELKEYVYIRFFDQKKDGSKTTKSISRIPKLAFSHYQKYIKRDLSKLKTLHKEFVDKQDYDNWLKNTFAQNKVQEILSLSQYIYLYFIHLSKNSMNTIDKDAISSRMRYKGEEYNQNLTHYSPVNMKQVNLGQIIGQVGNMLENGGWVPHVHIEAFSFMSPQKRITNGNRITRTFMTRKYHSIKDNQNPVDHFWKKSGYMNAKAIGTDLVYIRNKKSVSQWKNNGVSYKNYQALNRGQIDINEVFHLYNKLTPSVKTLIAN